MRNESLRSFPHQKEKILQINGLILERKVWLTKNEIVMEYDSVKGE